jgi:hypothetical protein
LPTVLRMDSWRIASSFFVAFSSERELYPARPSVECRPCNHV